MGTPSPAANQPKLPSIPKQTKVLSAPIVTVGLGLGCLLAWLRMSLISPGVFQEIEGATHVLELSYFVSLVSTVAALWLLGAFHLPCSKVLGRDDVRVIVPACLSLGTASTALGAAMGGAGTVLAVAGGLLTGVSSACLNIIFGVALSLLPTKHTVVACAVSLVSCDLLALAHTFCGPAAATVLCAAMPPASVFLMSYGFKSLNYNRPEERDPLPPQRASTDPSERKDLRCIQLTFSALLVAAGFVYEFVRVALLQLDDGASTHDLSARAAQATLTLALTALALVAALATVRRQGTAGPINCYHLILILLVVNALAMVAPAVYPGMPAIAALALNTASFDCLAMLMWVLVTGICGQYPQECFRFFAFMRAVWSTGPLLGGLAGTIVCRTMGVDLQTLFGAGLACATLLLVMGNFVFSEAVMNKALNILPSENRRRFVERCEAVIRDFGLSEREGEIMIMFAKGRNLPYVQQELCLSKGTVSTHRQHIYQKLGVHSAQEMIDLIQAYEV